MQTSTSSSRAHRLLTDCVRVLFGFNFLINGVNWWWKVLPYPTIGDPPGSGTPDFVQAMIETGFLFDMIKVIEVVAGTALLANRFVPLALVVAFPVTVAAWAVDIGLLGGSLRAQVMGWSVLLMNSFLMLAYLDSYRPMLTFRAEPGRASDGRYSIELNSGVVASIGVTVLVVGAVADGRLIMMAFDQLR